MRPPAQMIVACEFASATHDEIDAFIESYSKTEELPNNEIYEAYSKDIATSRKKLALYLRTVLPSFQVDSIKGVTACRSELKQQIDRLLKNSISQEHFCRFFNRMEIELIYTEVDVEIDFLGDLYNCCDCFDDNWQFRPNEYVIKEAKRMLSNIKSSRTPKIATQRSFSGA